MNQETAGFILSKDSLKDPALKCCNRNPEVFRDASSWRLSGDWRREFGESDSLSITPSARQSEMEFIQHFLPDKLWKKMSKAALARRANGVSH